MKFIIFNLYKKKFINISLLLFFVLYETNIESLNNSSSFPSTFSIEHQYNLTNFVFNHEIKNNSILILETNRYHYECTPGYSKYFIDLGYQVDIIIHSMGINAFSLFTNFEKINIFSYNNLSYIQSNPSLIGNKLKKYDFILIQSTEPRFLNLYKQLGLLNSNKTIFVMHIYKFIKSMNLTNYYLINKIWTLGNFPNSLRISPHYFGKIQLKDKNKVTKFFITSTINRNYKFLISASDELKKQKFNFEVVVVGKFYDFTIKDLPEQLKSNYKFRYLVTYFELYKEVLSSDFIIINLDPSNMADREFSKIRVSGSLSLSLGFFKPALINGEFAKLYNLTSNNSLIYNNNSFYYIMKKAIMLDNKQYKMLQKDLILFSDHIYQTSLNNVRISIDKV